MDDTLTNLTEDLANKAGWNGEFRSSRTGRCFQDLVDEFAFIRDVEVRQLFSEILAGRITRDRDVLPNVYDDRDRYENGSWAPADRTAEYDVLLRQYIEDRTLYEHNIIEEDYNNYILSVFEQAPASSSRADQERIQAEIAALAEKINALQTVYYETNDEYNEYLGAQNILMRSSVRVAERFPIGLFTVLIVVIFGALGCAGAALFGRIEDFIEYYAFSNKVDGLPNRAKCDQFIASRDGRPLPESFTCVVCRLTNLQAENARLGREAGDRMLKDFSAILTSVFPTSDRLFVGNNGAGQYLIFAESLGGEQAEAALFQAGVALEQKSRDRGYRLELHSGCAQAGKEKRYYIRELLSTAMKRTGAVKAAAG